VRQHRTQAQQHSAVHRQLRQQQCAAAHLAVTRRMCPSLRPARSARSPLAPPAWSRTCMRIPGGSCKCSPRGSYCPWDPEPEQTKLCHAPMHAECHECNCRSGHARQAGVNSLLPGVRRVPLAPPAPAGHQRLLRPGPLHTAALGARWRRQQLPTHARRAAAPAQGDRNVDDTRHAAAAPAAAAPAQKQPRNDHWQAASGDFCIHLQANRL
jgi:hypothetical protein